MPLWLAVALKKRGKCTIRPPEWMTVGKVSLFPCECARVGVRVFGCSILHTCKFEVNRSYIESSMICVSDVSVNLLGDDRINEIDGALLAKNY